MEMDAGRQPAGLKRGTNTGMPAFAPRSQCVGSIDRGSGNAYGNTNNILYHAKLFMGIVAMVFKLYLHDLR
jgi:hypothetical protein